MKIHPVEILIVSHSVALQEGLCALLEALPGVTSAKAIRELADATSWVETRRPHIIMLDAVLAGVDLLKVLETFESLSPKTQRILLVDRVEDMRWVPQYAEAILVKGAPASTVAAIVSGLLLSKGEENDNDYADQ